jgi:geranylgeranyl pyrophosphate synthase
MHCMSRCSSDDKRFVSSLVNRSGPYDQHEVSRLRKLIEETGSLDYVREKIAWHTTNARNVLGSVPKGEARSRLQVLAEYLAARYY